MRLCFVLTSLLMFNSAVADTAKIGHIHGLDYAPYSWWDEDSQTTIGYGRSLIELVFTTLNIDIVNIVVDSLGPEDAQPILRNLKSGALDVHLLNGDQALQLDYVRRLSPSVVTIEIRPFVLQDQVFEFRQWSDLKNKRGLYMSMQKNTIAGSIAFYNYAHRELNLHRVDSLNTMIAALEADEADYLIAVYRPTLLQLRLQKKQRDIIALDKSINSVPLYWVLSTKSPLLKKTDAIESLLSQYQSEGRFSLLMKQAMQRYISVKQSQPTRLD